MEVGGTDGKAEGINPSHAEGMGWYVENENRSEHSSRFFGSDLAVR